MAEIDYSEISNNLKRYINNGFINHRKVYLQVVLEHAVKLRQDIMKTPKQERGNTEGSINLEILCYKYELDIITQHEIMMRIKGEIK